MKTNYKATVNMEKFISLIPSCKQLRAYLNYCYKNDLIEHEMRFLWVVIEILMVYYEAIDVPLFNHLRKEVIPLASFFCHAQKDEEKLLKQKCILREWHISIIVLTLNRGNRKYDFIWIR